MRYRPLDLARFFALMLIAMLALPSVYDFQRTKVEAYAQGQSRSDVPSHPAQPKVKKPKAPGIVQGAAAPSNDNCANAINVTCPTFTDTKDTTAATDETGEPASECTDQGNSVWYTYTNPGPSRQNVTVQTCDSDFDTAVQVYHVTGAACAFASFVVDACNDDSDCGDGLQSTLSFLADPGQTYKIQAGGFDGETGSLTVNISCEELLCDDFVVHGNLGLGSADHPSVSGQQTPARLFRDGIPSTCADPKVCPGPFGSGSFTFDAYTFTNETSTDQCVTVLYNPNVDTKGNCNVNAHAIAYLNSFSPTNLCQNYLADVGSSDELPFSFTVPAGANFVVVIAANNPGGVGNGCDYEFTVRGNICEQFDFCAQDTNTPGRFIKINSTTGAYEFHDCSKGIVVSGVGTVIQSQPADNCKIELLDMGPNPKRPDRAISVLINRCTSRGDASIRIPGSRSPISIGDTNVFNNTCECPL
ncbi:MAG: hypothetical protein WBV94_03890 [Blastocatellia bacterium]